MILYFSGQFWYRNYIDPGSNVIQNMKEESQ